MLFFSWDFLQTYSFLIQKWKKTDTFRILVGGTRDRYVIADICNNPVQENAIPLWNSDVIKRWMPLAIGLNGKRLTIA